jgi:hypothetical protein
MQYYDISNLRKKIDFVETYRRKIIDYLLHPKGMISGSMHSAYKKCGNKSCRCAEGKLHGPFKYLSRKEGAKTNLTFVRRADEDDVERMAADYRKYCTHMTKLNKYIRL